MPINHASCDHERTPKARAICRRNSGAQAPAQRPARARVNDVTYTRRSGRYGALRALSDAPDVVRTFIDDAETRGFTMNEVAVDRGFSIEVYSTRGAARVTWDEDEVAWFTRLGYTSITTRVRTAKQVWKVLGVTQ